LTLLSWIKKESCRLIDLSLPLEEGEGERLPVKIDYHSHQAGARQMGEIFGVDPQSLPGGLGWAGEQISCLSHSGTHMDAPWHYSPVCQGRTSKTIDHVPLEWCLGEGVVLDMSHKKRGEMIRAGDIRSALAEADCELLQGAVVLIHTGTDRLWGTPQYPDAGPGMGRESTLWLVERGVKVIGIDTWGFDIPFDLMKKRCQRQGGAEGLWEAHYAGIEREYCQIEKLANLHLLPQRGFLVIAFPISISRASAGWVRCVALLEGQGTESSPGPKSIPI